MNDFRSIDGSNNNAINLTWGQADTQLMRNAPSDYGDGISTLAGGNRPGAREISNVVFAQSENTGNKAGLSDYLWVWGQFLDHDLSITENGLTADEAAVPVPTGDLMFDPIGSGTSNIAFTRSEFDQTTGTSTSNPREQVNQITAFLDGSQIYGSDEVRAAALRSDDGKLNMSEGNLLMFNTPELPNAPMTDPTLFLAGDVRANENIALTSMHTLFAREHNRLVDELTAKNPHWDGDTLYQETRKIVEAQLQMITYNEFLPHLIGEDAIADWSGYKADIDPQIANEFSTAAYRLGHTLLSSTVMRVEEDGAESEFGHLELRNAFFRPDRLSSEGGIDDILRGAAVGQSEELDAKIIDDVRNFLFGPPGAGGFDLAALNVQRGRDHGLDDYNDVREAYGLDRAESFEDITADATLQANLEQLFGTVDNIDLYVGGLAEDPVQGSMLGETFQAIVVDQFVRTRDGDSFWHENRLTDTELLAIGNVTLADIIERNTDIDHMQDDVFVSYERMSGTSGDDDMQSEQGHALMMAGEGNDVMVGSTGTEQMEGGAGDDLMVGEAGADIFHGGDGDDIIVGGHDGNVMTGDAGNDQLYSHNGNDTLDGGAGDDLIQTGNGFDRVMFSEGHDSVVCFDVTRDMLDFSNMSKINSVDDLSAVSEGDGLSISDSADNSIHLAGVSDMSAVNMTFVAGTEMPDDVSGNNASVLLGDDGDDLFSDAEGTQYVVGGGGNDTFKVSGNSTAYTVNATDDGSGYVIWNDAGHDIVWEAETLQFDDVSLEIDDLG